MSGVRGESRRVVAAEERSGDAAAADARLRRKRSGMWSCASSSSGAAFPPDGYAEGGSGGGGQVGRVEPRVEGHLTADQPRRVKMKGCRRRRRQVRLRQVVIHFR